MRTWEDYKNHVKAVSEEERRHMEEIEEVSDVVSSIIRIPPLAHGFPLIVLLLPVSGRDRSSGRTA